MLSYRFFFLLIHHNPISIAEFGSHIALSIDYSFKRLITFTPAINNYLKATSVACVSASLYKTTFDCGLRYIGEPKRSINDRLSEHRRCVQNKNPYSVVSKHVEESNNCVP